MNHFEVLETFRSIEGTRNGIGTRLKVSNLKTPLIVVQSYGDHFICCPEHRERAYIIMLDTWVQGEQVNLLRDHDTWRSLGVIKSVELLEGYEVDSLERDYGIEGQDEGPWAPPQYFKRRPGVPQKIRKVTR